jgi:hypothetical protein
MKKISNQLKLLSMKMFKTLLSMGLVLFLASCGGQKENKQESIEITEEVTELREDWNVSTVQGNVTAIDAETRVITLMGAEGNLVTVTASDAVERFDEIQVGDVITFDYLVYMMAEFREPTAEELAEPLVVIAEVAKAPEGIAPAGSVGAMVKGIVTIEALNRPFMLATVKGPRGNFLTINLKDPKFIEKLHIGQVVILTYAEATAISLTKVNAAE